MKNDGMMSDLDPRILELLRSDLDPVPMCPVILHCGCRVGRVTKIGGRNVLYFTSVNMIVTGVLPTGELHRERRRQRDAVLLDDPDRPVDVSCKHPQSGEPLPIDQIQRHVEAIEKGRARPGQPAIL